MLIGNKERFGFEIRPVVPYWESRCAPERGAWAALSIWIDGQNLCRHLLPGADQVHDDLFVPLGPIADWLVRSHGALVSEERAPLFPTTRHLHETLCNWGERPPIRGVDQEGWLDAREDWWTRHFLAAGADGAQLPNVALLRDDEELVIDWAPPKFAGIPAPQFLIPHGNGSVSWIQGRAVLDGFVRAVGGALSAAGLGGLYDWSDSSEPLPESPPDFAVALQMFTGRSWDELRALAGTRTEAQVIQWLGLSGASDPGASPASQALRDLPPRLPVEFRSILAELETATRAVSNLDWLKEARRVARDAMEGATSPEEMGQRAARATRALLALDSHPIADDRTLLYDCGVRLIDSPVERLAERMVSGARYDGGAAAILLSTPRTRTRWGHRFEAARALGHLLADALRGEAVGAGGSSYTTEKRRRRSGAFAAEMLLPATALEAETGRVLDAAAEPDEFEAIMRKYGVGARTAAHQLFNCGLLSTPSIRDELIETYAHAEPQ